MKIKDSLINIIHKYKIKSHIDDINIKYILKEDSFIAFFKINEILIEIFNNIDKFNKVFYRDGENCEENNSTLRMRVGGISKNVKLQGEGKLNGKLSYYESAVTENKIVDIPVYEIVRYCNAFTNIDILFSGIESNIRSEFIIKNVPDRNEVALIFEGATNIIAYNDFFGIYKDDDVIIFRKPEFYQEIEGIKILLKSDATILDNRIVLIFKYYDKEKMLLV